MEPTRPESALPRHLGGEKNTKTLQGSVRRSFMGSGASRSKLPGTHEKSPKIAQFGSLRMSDSSLSS